MRKETGIRRRPTMAEAAAKRHAIALLCDLHELRSLTSAFGGVTKRTWFREVREREGCTRSVSDRNFERLRERLADAAIPFGVLHAQRIDANEDPMAIAITVTVEVKRCQRRGCANPVRPTCYFRVDRVRKDKLRAWCANCQDKATELFLCRVTRDEQRRAVMRAQSAERSARYRARKAAERSAEAGRGSAA